jgi:hypothetical protein
MATKTKIPMGVPVPGPEAQREPGRDETPVPAKIPEDPVARIIERDREIDEAETGHAVPRG